MADNPFLPLSFIAGPAILTNAAAVLLNGASIRYNLAIGLWRDLQAELHGHKAPTASAYPDQPLALALANRRASLIVRGLNLLYAAVGGFGFSTLTGLGGAMLAGETSAATDIAKIVIVGAGAFGLVCLLGAAVIFILESRCTRGLLRLGMAPPRTAQEAADDQMGLGPSTTV